MKISFRSAISHVVLFRSAFSHVVLFRSAISHVILFRSAISHVVLFRSAFPHVILFRSAFSLEKALSLSFFHLSKYQEQMSWASLNSKGQDVSSMALTWKPSPDAPA